ncbi:MAG: Holliday junction resolvase RuvX [Prevotellaceae bacterium]|nr:Holliday junction resolvase RuvX [Prevotellaceae bacterium]
MARILAIDYGQKRVGLAVTDNLQIIATALDTVHSKDVIKYISEYIEHETVELFVVGFPKDLQNRNTDATKYVEAFIKHLGKAFPNIAVVKTDERFTSKIAFRTMIDGGLKKSDRRNKAMIDKISAVIILQSYLEQKQNEQNRNTN